MMVRSRPVENVAKFSELLRRSRTLNSDRVAVPRNSNRRVLVSDSLVNRRRRANVKVVPADRNARRRTRNSHVKGEVAIERMRDAVKESRTKTVNHPKGSSLAGSKVANRVASNPANSLDSLASNRDSLRAANSPVNRPISNRADSNQAVSLRKASSKVANREVSHRAVSRVVSRRRAVSHRTAQHPNSQQPTANSSKAP